jgi:uridine kinase
MRSIRAATRASAGRRGRAFEEPVYSSADYARTAETRRIEPNAFLIVEGLFVRYWPQLRAMLDTKVYVETAAEVCLARRLARDVAGRGRADARFGTRAVGADGTAERGVVGVSVREARGGDRVGEAPFEQSTAAVLSVRRQANAAARLSKARLIN